MTADLCIEILNSRNIVALLHYLCLRIWNQSPDQKDTHTPIEQWRQTNMNMSIDDMRACGGLCVRWCGHRMRRERAFKNQRLKTLSVSERVNGRGRMLSGGLRSYAFIWDWWNERDRIGSDSSATVKDMIDYGLGICKWFVVELSESDKIKLLLSWWEYNVENMRWYLVRVGLT